MSSGLRVGLLAAGAWLLIAVLAVANGTLREAILIPWLGNTGAQIASIALLLFAILSVEWFLVRGPWAKLPGRHLWSIGIFWVVGTVLFEFALGRLVLDMSWASLMAQYNFLEGSLWPLVPLVMLVGMPALRAWGSP